VCVCVCECVCVCVCVFLLIHFVLEFVCRIEFGAGSGRIARGRASASRP
jgi:hypothetical protein